MTTMPVRAQDLPALRRRAVVELFGSGSVGAVPDGRGRGTVLLGTGGLVGRLFAAVAYALLWRGKMVDARAGRLRNLLGPWGMQAVVGEVYAAPSLQDGGPCIVLDYSRTSWVARLVRDELREISPGLFVGLLRLRRRHVIDFALDFRP
jgi:hypothetical protein